jgi:hypothetical protein
MNVATEYLNDMLQTSWWEAVRPRKSKKTKKKKKPKTWRVDPSLFRSPPNPRFHPGAVDLSAGWFAQAHEVSVS